MPEVWPLRAARQQIWEEGGIFRDKSAMSRRRDRQPGSSVGFPLIGPQATVSLEELASFPRLLRGFAQIPPPGAVYDTEILRPNHPIDVPVARQSSPAAGWIAIRHSALVSKIPPFVPNPSSDGRPRLPLASIAALTRLKPIHPIPDKSPSVRVPAIIHSAASERTKLRLAR